MRIQRAPAKAAIYGVVFGAEPATAVSLEVATVSASGEVTSTYTVQGKVMPTDKQPPGGRYAQWKAFLKPAPAGGEFLLDWTQLGRPCSGHFVCVVQDPRVVRQLHCDGKLQRLQKQQQGDTSRCYVRRRLVLQVHEPCV